MNIFYFQTPLSEPYKTPCLRKEQQYVVVVSSILPYVVSLIPRTMTCKRFELARATASLQNCSSSIVKLNTKTKLTEKGSLYSVILYVYVQKKLPKIIIVVLLTYSVNITCMLLTLTQPPSPQNSNGNEYVALTILINVYSLAFILTIHCPERKQNCKYNEMLCLQLNIVTLND